MPKSLTELNNKELAEIIGDDNDSIIPEEDVKIKSLGDIDKPDKVYIDKKPLENKMPSADRIEIYKRNDNGELELCDIEITRDMLANYTLQEIIKKHLIKRYGYGEYIPFTIKPNKGGEESRIRGGSIKFAKPIDKTSDSNNMLEQVKDLFESYVSKIEQIRRENDERINKILEAGKISSPQTEKLDPITMMIQQQQQNMMLMMELMRQNKQETPPIGDVIAKALEPIVRKIRSLEDEIIFSDKKIPEIPMTPPQVVKQENILETIKNLKEFISPDKSIIDNLEKKINELNEKLTRTESESLKQTIQELKNRVEELSFKRQEGDNEGLGIIDNLVDTLDKIKEIYKKISPETSQQGNQENFINFLSDMVDKLPDAIAKIKYISEDSKNTSAQQKNSPIIQKAREQMFKLARENQQLRKMLAAGNKKDINKEENENNDDSKQDIDKSIKKSVVKNFINNVIKDDIIELFNSGDFKSGFEQTYNALMKEDLVIKYINSKFGSKNVSNEKMAQYFGTMIVDMIKHRLKPEAYNELLKYIHDNFK